MTTEPEFKPMMTCGHVANAIGTRAGTIEEGPACAICSCFDVAPAAPDLTGRVARCSYFNKCHSEVPSSTRLAFFEDGRVAAGKQCIRCGYFELPHTAEERERNRQQNRRSINCKEFTPKPDPGHDHYYCGCMGWD